MCRILLNEEKQATKGQEKNTFSIQREEDIAKPNLDAKTKGTDL